MVDSVYVLKVMPTAFADGVDMEYESEGITVLA